MTMVPEDQKQMNEVGGRNTERWPWHAMPSALAGLGGEIVEKVGVPEEMVGLGTLVAAGIAIGNAAEVVIKDDHRQNANLFGMIVAPSGGYKSPLFKELQRPFLEWESNQVEGHRRAVRGYMSRQDVLETRLKGLLDAQKKQARSQGGRKGQGLDLDALTAQIEEVRERQDSLGDMPVKPTLVAQDITSEALGRLMAANGERLALWSADAAQVLAVARGRYAGVGADIQFYLSGWSGDTYKCHRSGGKAFQMGNPCLSSLLATQPATLAEVFAQSEIRRSGFFARFLFVQPETGFIPYPLDAVTQSARSRYGDLIGRLIALGRDGATGDGPTPSLELRFTHDGLLAWKRRVDTLRKRLHEARLHQNEVYSEWAQKLGDQVARIALILHLCERLDSGEAPTEIRETEVLRAWEIGDVLDRQARRVFEEFHESATDKKARRVLEWALESEAKLRSIRQEEGLGDIFALKPSDIQRFGVGGVKERDETRELLGILEDRGKLARESVPGRGGKTKKHVVWHVHGLEKERDG